MKKHLNEIIGAATGLGVAWLAFSAIPEQPFLTVHSLSVQEGEVWADRTINSQGRTVADWRVTVVPLDKDAPVCQTIPGDMLHQGWSVYSEDRQGLDHWDIDEWVGEVGCEDQLVAGTYDMFVTWTPRDGTRPVAFYAEFDWP